MGVNNVGELNSAEHGAINIVGSKATFVISPLVYRRLILIIIQIVYNSKFMITWVIKNNQTLSQ